ncbi:MAG: hypothetical protein VKO21_08650 [Candidatus Sericytochromatia bacterium]|nr:hypothetical protein [Candidatus Sericytochromatia bacterium]
MTTPKPDLLAQAAQHILLTSEEADTRFGEARPGSEEEVDTWAHQARYALGEAFDADWSGPPEQTVENLEALAANWPERPEDEALAGMALEWGALLGEDLLADLGGHWVLRDDPLHHALRFPRLALDFLPMHAILARFILGEAASLERIHEELVQRLTSS